MVYYFGGKFNPWTRGHEDVLSKLCEKIRSDHDWNPSDLIVIGVTKLKDESGVRGHQLCSSEEYRIMSIAPAVRRLQKAFPFTDGKIDIVCQTKDYTYEFLEEFMKKHKTVTEDWMKNITLVLGEDELIDLENSTTVKQKSGYKPVHTYWMYADELSKLPCFAYKRDNGISATKVREILHRNPYVSYDEVKQYIHKSTFDVIKSYHIYWQFGHEDEYRRVENNRMKEYDITKFPRPSATVDIMVIKHAEHDPTDKILLIRRKNYPYLGFWALPGGFLDINEDESLEEAAQRELNEEAGIFFKFTRNNQFRTYSDMGVDPRGRIIDTVFVTVGDNWVAIAGDDASEVCWFNIDDLPRMAFNHRQIIEDYVQSKTTPDPEEVYDECESQS